jgi:hypothetical protein
VIKSALGWVGFAAALGSSAITAAVSSSADGQLPFEERGRAPRSAVAPSRPTLEAGAARRRAATGALRAGPRPASALCDDCSTHTFVKEAIDACEGATDLAANGTPKRVLCIAYLDCARENDCVLANRFDESGCFCGFNDRAQGPDLGTCFGTQRAAQGPCRAEAEAAAESTDITDINEAWLRPDSALGRANEVLRRQLELCSDDGGGGECFPYL